MSTRDDRGRRRVWPAVAPWALMIAAAVSPVAAQLPTYGLGRAPTAAEVEAWKMTIPFDGVGLPAGSGTAVLGHAIYVERCAACHGERGENGKYDRPAGGRGTLTTDRPVLTVGSFWPMLQPSGATSIVPSPLTSRLPDGRSGLCGHRVSSLPQWDNRRARGNGRADVVPGEDAELRRVRPRPASRPEPAALSVATRPCVEQRQAVTGPALLAGHLHRHRRHAV